MTPPIETPRAWDDACRRSATNGGEFCATPGVARGVGVRTGRERGGLAASSYYATPRTARVRSEEGSETRGETRRSGRRIGAMREIVTAQNLDVAETAHAAASWALAASELGKMNQFKVLGTSWYAY